MAAAGGQQAYGKTMSDREKAGEKPSQDGSEHRDPSKDAMKVVPQMNVASAFEKSQTRREDESNPLVVLRKRQTQEYKKICTEMRLSPNSGVLKMLDPEDARLVPGSRFTTADLSADFAKLRRATEHDGDATFRAAVAMADSADAPAPEETKQPTIAKETSVFSTAIHGYDFDANFLGDKQFLPLCVALAVDPLLEYVKLANTGLRDAGLVALCEQLKRSKTLQLIDVSQNRFSISGAKALLSLAQAVPTLDELIAVDTCLDLAFCERRALQTEYRALSMQISQLLEQRRLEAQESGDD